MQKAKTKSVSVDHHALLAVSKACPLPVKRSHASFAINSTAILISTACLLVLGEEYSKYKGHKDFK